MVETHMSYTIVITESKIEKKLVKGEWAQVGEEPVTQEDVNKAYSQEKVPPMKAVFGYTPDVERSVTSERELLKQEVESLDFVAVVKAINRL